MKRSLNPILSFLLVFLLVPVIYGQGPTSSKSMSVKSTDSKPTAGSARRYSGEDIERDMAEALTVIEANHFSGRKLDYNELFKSAIDSMLHTLDPHSNYFDAKESEDFRTNQSSQYFGIGATIGDLSDSNGKVIGTFIKATFDTAPAHRAGLRYGDKIIEVNGKSMLGLPYFEVRDFLRGPRGTVAKIKVERFGTGQQEEVEIIRDAVSQPSIAESYMIRPGVGYIGMTGGFNQTTFNEFRVALQELKSRGMTNLVLDLRNNGGGLVSQAFQVANSFLSSGQAIFTQKSRLGATSTTFTSDNFSPDETPVVVLVNRNTASASEILAGALQDHDRALIVGENTFGKGLVQNPFPLEYGSMLLLTIAKYETPSGRLIQRDYSDGNLYDYYTNGGSLRADEPATPEGRESRTDSGRVVYSGGGIQPDEFIKAQTITATKARFQQKLGDPIFAFVLNLTFSKVQGFESYKVDRPILFNYTIKAGDFPINERIYEAFTNFATTKYKFTKEQIDGEREFVERALRTEFVTAAFGSTASFQVFNEYDTQLKRAIDLLPEAKQLAIEGARANAAKGKSDRNR